MVELDMADNPKLEVEENMGSQKISVLDHLKGFEYRTEKSENFVIDMENFSHGGISNKDVNNSPNSRITLQRSLSRKGSSRGGGGGGGDTAVPASSSPRAAALVGSSMPEKASLVAAVPAGHSINNPQTHHQITINTTSSNINTSMESRFALRRNSFKRPPFSWAVDPKRVLFFFATLSSMGTILLIYFTLSIGGFGDEDTGLG